MARVLLDLKNPVFQEHLFSLDKKEALAVLATLQKIRGLEWEELYRDKGVRWEAIQSRRGPQDERMYSLRVTRRVRAVANREGQFLRLLSLHADHDSAY